MFVVIASSNYSCDSIYNIVGESLSLEEATLMARNTALKVAKIRNKEIMEDNNSIIPIENAVVKFCVEASCDKERKYITAVIKSDDK